VHSPMCLCLLHNVKPDASIIQSTALRRFPDALARAILFTPACTRERRAYAYVRQVRHVRSLPLQDIPGRPQGWPRDTSRDTDVTLGRVTHVALTLSEICAARHLSSWRFRAETSRPQRHSFPFFVQKISRLV